MRILVVEDYPQVAKRVARLSKEILGKQLTSLQWVSHFAEAQEFLRHQPIDLLLLDLNLGGADGFDLLKHSVAESFQTIIISANSDRALQAFEYGVLDFVAKPFGAERLAKAFDRLARPWEKMPKYLAVKSNQGIRLISLNQVHYIQGAGNYAELHLSDGTLALHEKNLDSLQSLLAQGFVRIHKSYLVRIDQIAELVVHGGGRYELLLKSGLRLPVGRTRYRALRERLV